MIFIVDTAVSAMPESVFNWVLDIATSLALWTPVPKFRLWSAGKVLHCIMLTALRLSNWRVDSIVRPSRTNAPVIVVSWAAVRAVNWLALVHLKSPLIVCTPSSWMAPEASELIMTSPL